MNYRQKIYSRYRTLQGLQPSVDNKAADRWGQAYDTWLRRWMPQDRGAAIADLGCGSGVLLRYFQLRGYSNISGVDLSAEQLSAAKRFCENVYLDNATEFLKARPSKFDLIVSLDLIEHLRKDELVDFLAAAHDALQPHGRLILQTPNCASPCRKPSMALFPVKKRPFLEAPAPSTVPSRIWGAGRLLYT